MILLEVDGIGMIPPFEVLQLYFHFRCFLSRVRECSKKSLRKKENSQMLNLNGAMISEFTCRELKTIHFKVNLVLFTMVLADLF